jgi:hypothetical protein
MEIRYLTTACLAAFLANPLQAAVYTWTDEQGRVHYSDRPSHESATEKEVRIPESVGPDSQTSPQDRKALRQRMLDLYQQERAERREAAEQRKQERKERKRLCLDARARYDLYNNTGPIYDFTESGERAYLNRQERDQYIAELKAEVERYCD